MKKWGAWIAALLLMIMLVSGCSSGSQDKAAVAEDGRATDQMASSADRMAVHGMNEAASEPSSKNSEAKSDSVSEAPAAPASTEPKLPNTASQTSAGVAGFNSQDGSGGLNKKLMYKANIVMEIPDYGKAQSEIRNMVTLSGGYIVNFSETQSMSEKGGTFVIKVPATGFSPFLNSLEKIKHENMQQSIEGQDVTEEYVDLESRLKAKQIMEEQYTDFMKKATKTNDLVAFANELERIQTEIEQIKGRMRYIDQNVSYSTIEIRIYEAVKEPVKEKEKDIQAPLGKRASNAFQGSIDVITLILQWIVVILSGSLPLLIIAAIFLLVFWLVRRSRRSSREEAAKKRKELNAGSIADPKDEKAVSEDPKDEQ
ncbi:DUF4349 domain-containing protein [Paenibacillus sp. KQZ6P-2]|uniref:DUF4349 domain-containing protein n=1 Tax=Paenibacillus mangrovi TaxID=2931978 RepID=A0A9X2B757_9BACL|nr:DUF4349 domain-containing protein [Paenibacillus mangrovi]MCJ8013413.1 DUF4349 domain-containing protein [Paenibacillus mangrovi]